MFLAHTAWFLVDISHLNWQAFKSRGVIGVVIDKDNCIVRFVGFAFFGEELTRKNLDQTRRRYSRPCITTSLERTAQNLWK